MRTRVVLHAVLLFSMLTCALAIAGADAPSTPEYASGRESTVRLTFGQGGCTGVVTEHPNVVLTTAHCLDGDPTLVSIDGHPAPKVVRVTHDGYDHTYLTLDRPVGKPVAKLAPMPPPGTEVYIWGNPAGLAYQLRVGRVAGQVGPEWAARFAKKGIRVPFNTVTLDLNAWNGDSGGPIFDRRGRVVGIVSMRFGSTSQIGAFKLTLAIPLMFTHQQMQELT